MVFNPLFLAELHSPGICVEVNVNSWRVMNTCCFRKIHIMTQRQKYGCIITYSIFEGLYFFPILYLNFSNTLIDTMYLSEYFMKQCGIKLLIVWRSGIGNTQASKGLFKKFHVAQKTNLVIICPRLPFPTSNGNWPNIEIHHSPQTSWYLSSQEERKWVVISI